MFSKIKSKDKASKLREHLNAKDIIVMPGCYDSLSAKLIEKEGLGVGFMSGFAVSSTRLGMPDTGLISFLPTNQEIDENHTNLCRCGTYERIRKAIHRAADLMKAGN